MKNVTLAFTKVFNKGLLKGISIQESLPFVSKERAEAWIAGVTNNNKTLNYVIEAPEFV